MNIRHKKMARAAQRCMWRGKPRPWDRASDCVFRWYVTFRRFP